MKNLNNKKDIENKFEKSFKIIGNIHIGRNL